ncbi:alpha-amylase/4-alpha-glucanotransferase domain-containing protein [Sulfurirhabdus autotrophica]|uniref:Alpha-amylase n=1 Tax=Sulfurirhabdus autotrophica TaxID=1706046 RepID=A0A4R3Y135_9PROT|nr:alpha-amylase/4-alpha-glucanotransferase domain-containing protein [Sulfurirhabdus autotrophica]TCV85386.1 alpha-amylase [Sulfurirhabdus autotrophica]
MTHSVKLLLGVHAHQPVGNFPEVLEEAHLKCYQPFIQTLYRYPDFHYAIHFSGWLLDYLLQHYPKDMAMLREMVGRGQAELFGGGDTEPVLAVIPNEDRIGQVNALSDKLKKTLGSRPDGAWLTERVWEATVVPGLADAGIRYVTVDDYHFLCSGRKGEELKGFFSTEEDNRNLDLFPISEGLRYRLPFSPAPDAVKYLEEMAETGSDVAAIYFDDIEKFGIWPDTYEWVYEKGWLKDFIEGVLASGKIQTQRYSDYHANNKTRGIVYLPTTSYIEMNEWTLPASAANHFADMVHASKENKRFEQDKAFLRGGIWKNFFSRYPESNWMHKRMLSVSRRFHAMPEAKRTDEMVEMLYQSQANDAYWHGLFGGLYLPHLRRAVYRAIIALEGMLDKISPRLNSIREDLDKDGCDEIFLQDSLLQAVVKLDGLGAVCELDAYQLNHNFGDSLRRSDEHYYRKIKQGELQHHSGDGIASAHDRVSFKHEITQEDLVPDSHARVLFLDGWQADATQDVMPVTNYVLKTEHAEKQGLTLGCQIGNVLVSKHVAVSENHLRLTYRFSGQGEGEFSTTLNVAMPSCDGPAGRFIHDGHILGGFGQPLALNNMKEIMLDDAVLGGKLLVHSSKPVSFHAAPHFTVSQSEAGFEKIMQAVTLVLTWPLGSRYKEITIDLEVVKYSS